MRICGLVVYTDALTVAFDKINKIGWKVRVLIDLSLKVIYRKLFLDQFSSPRADKVITRVAYMLSGRIKICVTERLGLFTCVACITGSVFLEYPGISEAAKNLLTEKNCLRNKS